MIVGRNVRGRASSALFIWAGSPDALRRRFRCSSQAVLGWSLALGGPALRKAGSQRYENRARPQQVGERLVQDQPGKDDPEDRLAQVQHTDLGWQVSLDKPQVGDKSKPGDHGTLVEDRNGELFIHDPWLALKDQAGGDENYCPERGLCKQQFVRVHFSRLPGVVYEACA